MSEIKRTVGNRRTEEELEAYKKEKITTKFKLKDQPNFKGSPELLEKMQEYERAYREGNPIITDLEWDRLVKETGYEESLDEIVAPGGRKWLKMLSPLPSLKKVRTIEDLHSYFSRFPEDQEFIIAGKLDGLTANLRYTLLEDGSAILTAISTRGDGLNGLIIYDNALDGVECIGLPKTISRETVLELKEKGYVIDNRIEVRGEAVINKGKYFEENEIPTEERKAFVPRSIAAGIFNSKDPGTFGHVGTIVSVESSLSHILKKDISETGIGILNDIWDDLDKSKKKLLSSFGLLKGRNSKGYEKIVAFDDIVNSCGEKVLFCFEDGVWSRCETIDDMKYKGKLRKLHLYFVSFSMSSIRGNIDDGGSTFSKIPGILSMKDIEELNPITKITSDTQEIIEIIDLFYGTKESVRDFNLPRLKNLLPIACDGICIKPVGSDINTQEMKPRKYRGGKIAVPKYPSDQCAVKYESDPVKTKIIDIVTKETKLGNKTVSAIIEPTVVEQGSTVCVVNLHNLEWFYLPENSWIKPGVECWLQMSQDIIPVLSPIEKYNI